LAKEFARKDAQERYTSNGRPTTGYCGRVETWGFEIGLIIA